MGILHRTIFVELAKVFLLSLVGFTGIIVLAAVVQDALQRGLSPLQIVMAIPLIIPSMMPFIVPPTTLFATCLVYGRLAHDNEITAIKAAGISVLHVVWPGVLLGLLTSISTLGLYYHIIPYSHFILRTAIVNDVEDFLYTVLKKDHEIRRRPELKLNYEMWVRQVQGRTLKDAIFMRRDQKGNYDVIAKADEAELRWDVTKREVVVHMRRCHVFDEAGKTRGYFDDRYWSVPVPDVQQRTPSPRDLTWQQILADRVRVTNEMETLTTQIALVVSQQFVNAVPGPNDLDRQRENLEFILKQHRQRIYALDAELAMRPALSFGCLFFVLVGCPVGIWFSRSDYLSAFITCFLPIVFVYYPLQLCSTGLAKDGKLHPQLALWSANAVLSVMALGLFKRLLKN